MTKEEIYRFILKFSLLFIFIVMKIKFINFLKIILPIVSIYFFGDTDIVLWVLDNLLFTLRSLYELAEIKIYILIDGLFKLREVIYLVVETMTVLLIVSFE